MSRKLIVRPIAEEEMGEAKKWYSERSPEAGEKFARHIKQVIEEFLRHPKRFPIRLGDVREAPVPDFPYCIYYRDIPARIVVVAVYHQSRNPDNLASRH